MSRRSLTISTAFLFIACGEVEPAPQPSGLIPGSSASQEPTRLSSFATDAVKSPPFEFDREELTVDQIPPGEVLVHEVDAGFLVGTNSGEFGGGVWWFSRDGRRRRRILQANCVAIASSGRHAIIVSGLAHMGARLGEIHVLECREDMRWERRRSLPLPGAPSQIELAGDGGLSILVEPRIVVLADRTFAFPDPLSVRYVAGQVRYE